MLFNSHPHKEDDNDLPEPGVPLYFSTHILTRRMTMPGGNSPFGMILFNSHPHKEDDFVIPCNLDIRIFSTHILTRRMT